MISTLTGTRTAVGLDWVVLDVHGIGFRVHVPPSTVADLLASNSGEVLTLFTSMIVREDSMSLYGFVTDTERVTFDALIGVSGIGPRIALAALSVLTPAQIAAAIESEDLAALQKVPGVGRKSAQRLVMDLGGKLTGLQTGAGTESRSEPIREEVEEALVQLGWTKPTVVSTLDGIDGTFPDSSSLLRAALQVLGPKRG